MHSEYCKICRAHTPHKRQLGIGTLLLALLTGGLWIIAIPFYPVRCSRCGAGWIRQMTTPLLGRQGKREDCITKFLNRGDKPLVPPEAFSSPLLADDWEEEPGDVLCPTCREIIQEGARRCKHCGEILRWGAAAVQSPDERVISVKPLARRRKAE